MYQRDTTELCDQRFLSIRAFQTGLEAFAWTRWGLGDGSIPLDHLRDGAVILGYDNDSFIFGPFVLLMHFLPLRCPLLLRKGSFGELPFSSVSSLVSSCALLV